LDFYLPLIKTCIEVHGEQHFKFVPFYHNNILNFLKSKKRDQEKAEWCEKNSIKYISLAYNESEQLWREKIKHE
jgi:predicted adenine nucleotide alpha hydrolase (AANH) superfamily ATPase